MCDVVHISGKLLSINGSTETEKMNYIAPDVGDLSDALFVFNLESPSEVAITNGDVREGSIRRPSQDLIETEISKSEAI